METLKCTCPTKGNVCAKGADVAGLPLGRVPNKNMSCFLTAHNPLRGVNAPVLSWDSNGSLVGNPGPAEWAQQLVDMNATCDSYSTALGTFVQGLKRILGIIHDNRFPPVHEMSTMIANSSFLFDWMTEMERYVDAAFETYTQLLAAATEERGRRFKGSK